MDCLVLRDAVPTAASRLRVTHPSLRDLRAAMSPTDGANRHGQRLHEQHRLPAVRCWHSRRNSRIDVLEWEMHSMRHRRRLSKRRIQLHGRANDRVDL